MAGLLGAMVAGGVSGFAKSRMDTLEKREAFDLKMELMNAETEKQMMLKREGIKMEDDRAQARRDKVKEIEGRVKDPYEGKGGYESEADAEKRQRGLLEQRANELLKEGYEDEASNRYKRIDTFDKNAAGAAKLENDRWKAEVGNNIKQQGIEIQKGNAERLNDIAEWKMKNIQNGGGYKPTEQDRRYEAYVNSVKTNGRKDKNGKLSKTPMDYDSWWAYYNNQPKDSTESVTTKTIDAETGSETSVTTKGKAQPKAPQRIGKYVVGKGIVYQ